MASSCELLSDAVSATGFEQLAQAVAKVAWSVEGKFSRYLSGNIVDQINSSNGRPVAVDEETARLLDYCAVLYALSERRFDITSGALRTVWTFDGSDNIPSAKAVDVARRRVGWHKVDWTRPRLILPAGMQIDLGGVGKEYAVDKAADVCRQNEAASCLVNFGGDLAISKPRSAGKSWQVGVEPVATSGRLRTIELREGALATSGDSRRYLEKDGVRYSHILDPTTGWPVTDAPHSVTVLSGNCTQAGMLATLASLAGAQAEAFLDAQEVKYWIHR